MAILRWKLSDRLQLDSVYSQHTQLSSVRVSLRGSGCPFLCSSFPRSRLDIVFGDASTDRSFRIFARLFDFWLSCFFSPCRFWLNFLFRILGLNRFLLLLFCNCLRTFNSCWIRLKVWVEFGCLIIFVRLEWDLELGTKFLTIHSDPFSRLNNIHWFLVDWLFQFAA